MKENGNILIINTSSKENDRQPTFSGWKALLAYLPLADSGE